MNIEVMKHAVYRHYKGNYYYVLAVAQHTETGEELVVYHSLYGEGDTWARSKQMFLSKVPEGADNPHNQTYRFEIAMGFNHY